MTPPNPYPFAALVDQQPLREALLTVAVDPSIGGVLIRGHKGSGKTTAVRALAALLPPISVAAGSPFNRPPGEPEPLAEVLPSLGAGGSAVIPTPLVELPLSTSEERLVGSLDLSRALKEGERRFEPGLLARANRGILYVDEVNLLEDHLVDTLLDCSASGTNRVERDAFSLVHPARFMLVGTMNPEEGDLRPQFLDRFGLCVMVKGVSDAASRREIVSRRIAFESDPQAFVERWAEAQEQLRDLVSSARRRLEQVEVPERCWERAMQLVTAAKTQGHRAELVLIKTARALAALTERESVSLTDIEAAARYALPHRVALSPLSNPERGETEVAGLIAADGNWDEERLVDDEQLADDEVEDSSSMAVPGDNASGSIVFTFLKKKRTTL